MSEPERSGWGRRGEGGRWKKRRLGGWEKNPSRGDESGGRSYRRHCDLSLSLSGKHLSVCLCVNEGTSLFVVEV